MPEAADRLIRGGTVVNVYSGELLPGQPPAREIVDAAGSYVSRRGSSRMAIRGSSTIPCP